MKLLYAIFLVAWGATAFAVSQPSEQPPLPYYDWGACPFECCTYRKWQATAPVTIYKSRNKTAEVAFRLKQEEWVQGVTGVVITYQFGISKILKPLQLGYQPKGDKPELLLQPGEILYTLHYAGEGYDLFWYKGKVYLDQISGDEPTPDPPSPELSLQIISRPKYVLWVKVRNKDGLIGWTEETDKFGNMDACG